MTQQYLEHSREILSSEGFSEEEPESVFLLNERRGVGRISIFGYLNRYNLKKGFPLLTTKKMGFKTVAHELVWFLHGETNIKYLVDNNVHIWDDDAFKHNLKSLVEEGIFPQVFESYSEAWIAARDEYVQRIKEDSEFAKKWGELGPVYGSQWVHWPKFHPIGKQIVDGEEREIYIKDPNGINQLERLIEGMKKNLTSSRHIVTAWNPQEVPDMALPPCHCLFQLNSDGEKLNLLLYQRSCDMFLGVPFNIASYSMLTTIMAQQLGLERGKFVHTFGDVHFYCGAGDRAKWYRDNLQELKKMVRINSHLEGPQGYLETLDWINRSAPPEEPGKEGMDHVTGILEQLAREPKPLPRVKIADKPYKELTIDDFVLEGYEFWPKIERTLIVG